MTDVDRDAPPAETSTTDAPTTDAPPVDGRVARRQRNIDRVIDVVLEMFSEDALFPTIEQVRDRSGLSLRSLYRYFADPGELVDAVIRRTVTEYREVGRLHEIGEGPLDGRIDDFVDVRLRLHEAFGAVQRASRANAPRHSSIREQLARGRDEMRAQFALQFAPELNKRKTPDREAVLAAGDVLTQIESIDFLRRHRQLSVAETRAALTTSLRSLLA